MAVSGINSLSDNSFRVIFGYGDNAQAQLGDVDAIVEADMRNSAW